MKTTSRIILYLSLALFSACSSDNAARETNTEAPVAETVDTLAQQPAPKPASDIISYEKKLESGSMHFLVTTTGEGSMRHLTIQLEREGQQPSRIDEDIEGTVTNSVITDLNGNKKPELLVFLNGGGTGSYGKVYGYEFDNQYWGELHMPELTPEQQQGYMGHDEFQVAGNRLVRTFPVYLDTDANCCPSGGTRTIFYTLDNALNFIPGQAE
ncbi:hypothetical protein I2I11_00325 [Pontibacter sp. 172403-2]|uniref:hypothetical protein n=1 Tax=Pontibacter rufus TaxID=2791028 RepID=UPI0018AF814B|nr:hypothetical protein [Pontibacter sp. 172403-2]MBF9251729.1 hypothetical protein [Pontibacter sp. 172403-2]